MEVAQSEVAVSSAEPKISASLRLSAPIKLWPELTASRLFRITAVARSCSRLRQAQPLLFGLSAVLSLSGWVSTQRQPNRLFCTFNNEVLNVDQMRGPVSSGPTL